MLLNLVYWTGIFLWVRGFAPGKLERALATLTVGFSGIVVALELLSFFRGISFSHLAALSAVVAFSGLSWNGRSGRAETPRDAPAQGGFEPGRMFSSAAVILAAWVSLWAALDHLALGVARPVPVDSDAPIYHLPFAIQWAKAGSLTFVPAPFGEESASYFPANGELWLTWLLATGSGHGILKVGQWPFLLAGALAIYGLGRQRGASQEAAILPATLWAILPLTLHQSIRANVDLIWTAFYFIGLLFSLRFQEGLHQGENRSDLVIAGLAMGCVLGTKSVGLVFVPLIGLPLAWVLLTRSRHSGDLGWLTAGICLPAAFWYLRNAWWTGNPVYPLDVWVFGERLFQGWYGRAEMAATAYHLPASAWPVLMARLCVVMGPLLAGTWAVSVAIGLWRGKRLILVGSPRTDVRIFACLAVLHVLIYWLVIPYNTQERFLLPAMGLGLLPLSALITARPRMALGLVLVLLAHIGGSAASGPFMTPAHVFPFLWSDLRSGAGVCVFATAVILMWLGFPAGLSQKNRFLTVSKIVAALAAFCAAFLWIGPDSSGPSGFYPRAGFGKQMIGGWQIVEESSPPGGQRIAYCGTNLPYYLFGVGLRNEVSYVAINDKPQWQPHDFHKARQHAGKPDRSAIPWPHWDREKANYEDWLDNLARRQIDLLFVSRMNYHGRLMRPPSQLPEFPIEQQWADAHPEHFEFLGPRLSPEGTAWTRVYRLKKSPGLDEAARK